MTPRRCSSEPRLSNEAHDAEGWEALGRSVPLGWPYVSAHPSRLEANRRDARRLRDWAAGELAAGRDPRKELRRLQLASMQRRSVTVDAWFRRWIESRIDVQERTRKLDVNAADRFKPLIGHVDVLELLLADVQEAIGRLAAELEPTPVRKYLTLSASLSTSPASSPVWRVIVGCECRRLCESSVIRRPVEKSWRSSNACPIA